MKNFQTRREQGNAILILIILVLLVVGGVGFWLWWQNKKPAKTGTAPTMAITTCSSLSLSKGTSDGTAGTIYTHATITNTGSVTCTLTGYPAAFLLDSGGGVLGSGAEANPLYPVTTVTLAPGGKAHSVLAFPDAGNFDPGICSAASATLQLYLPGIVTPITAAWADHSCPGFSASALQSGA